MMFSSLSYIISSRMFMVGGVGWSESLPDNLGYMFVSVSFQSPYFSFGLFG